MKRLRDEKNAQSFSKKTLKSSMRQEASQLKLSRENFSIDSSREQSLGEIENLKMEIIKRGTDLEQNKNSEIDIS